jgi:hypothetical protein
VCALFESRGFTQKEESAHPMSSSVASRLSRNRPYAALRQTLAAIKDDRMLQWAIMNLVQDWTCMARGIFFCRDSHVRIRQTIACALCEGRRTNRKLTATDMQLAAQAKEGKCLSTVYGGPKDIVLWECQEGHQFRAKVDAVLYHNLWCPECAGRKERRKVTLQTLQELATSRGGRCLSTEYQNTNCRADWQCRFGHQWSALISNVMYQDTWCPECGGSSREQFVRSIVERMFGVAFPSCRPGWLTNTASGRKLELDCYNESLQLAFEVDGGQHDRVVAHFGQTDASFAEMQARDRLKDTMCKEKGVVLVRVPDSVSSVKLQRHLLDELLKHEVKLPVTAATAIDIHSLPRSTKTEITLNRCHQYASARGGQCLSATFTAVDVPLVWDCGKQHQWKATANHVLKGSWCLQCRVASQRLDLTVLQNFALSKGGECLSTAYVNNRTKILWRCANSHEWEARSINVLKGSWCPTCARANRPKPKKRTLADFQDVATKNGGVCLSTSYPVKRVKFRCAKGHEWDVLPLNVLNKGSWCRSCNCKGRIPKKHPDSS